MIYKFNFTPRIVRYNTGKLTKFIFKHNVNNNILFLTFPDTSILDPEIRRRASKENETK